MEKFVNTDHVSYCLMQYNLTHNKEFSEKTTEEKIAREGAKNAKNRPRAEKTLRQKRHPERRQLPRRSHRQRTKQTNRRTQSVKRNT